MIVFSSFDDPRLREMLLAGAVGVLPTDTIYGLVASAHAPQAVARLYKLKEREQKPGTTIAADVEQLIRLGLPEELVRRVAHLWPNSLSIEIPGGEQLAYLQQNTGRSAFRVVPDERVRSLLTAVGPLVTSSANHPGMAPANTIAEAQAYFGDDVDFYVDAGDRSNRPPSTIARLLPNGELEIIRQGIFNMYTKRNEP
ncbi:MAG TPA: L-threonylcarbamoyladenylate synthase [Candidatus Saccharimonadales bacterium]|nr:L-threonylcarbamoyladenylate synthase [Candidatus Saccharimonadales bacterium]